MDTSRNLPVESRNVLVIGAGAAGLTAALEASGSGPVLIVSTTAPDGGSSNRAQGGIAAALDDDDTPSLHADDTLRAGRGLCRPSAVDVLVREGPAWIERLTALGVPFGPESGLEGGHQRRRIHHVGGAETGRALVAALWAEVRGHPTIELASGERVVALETAQGRCIGARTDRRVIHARAIILATGGYAALFARTTNPLGSRGEGVTLAYRAGAALADLEFVQFHPTALRDSGALLSEALRGEGALLLDEHGERFVDELAPRDEVARAIFARGGALLDLRPVRLEHFPSIVDAIRRTGLDPAIEPVPVSPAAHYTMGGVRTDLDGRTTVAGLFAAGECACTGVHGANRLASNSLLECVVFGGRAGRAAAAEPAADPVAGSGRAPESPDAVTDDVRDLLWRDAGVVRDEAGLTRVTRSPHALARLIGESALLRRESRGSHQRSDAPGEDPALARHVVLSRDAAPVWEEWR